MTDIYEDIVFKLYEMDRRKQQYVTDDFKKGWHAAISELKVFLQYKLAESNAPPAKPGASGGERQ